MRSFTNKETVGLDEVLPPLFILGAGNTEQALSDTSRSNAITAAFLLQRGVAALEPVYFAGHGPVHKEGIPTEAERMHEVVQHMLENEYHIKPLPPESCRFEKQSTETIGNFENFLEELHANDAMKTGLTIVGGSMHVIRAALMAERIVGIPSDKLVTVSSYPESGIRSAKEQGLIRLYDRLTRDTEPGSSELAAAHAKYRRIVSPFKRAATTVDANRYKK